MSDYENVTPDVAAKMIERGECFVIDVRTKPEFLSHRIPGAYLLPLQELAQRHPEIPRASTKKLLLVCEHGVRSRNACAGLAQGGWKSLVNMSGGMAEWLECNLAFASGETQDAVDLGPPK